MISTPRIGSVCYLNALPLIYGIEKEIRSLVPSALSRELRIGNLDVGLIPVAEYLEHPDYRIVPHIAIGCRGEVQSVFLASRKPLPEIQTLSFDPASKTSNLLVQVLLREYFGISPKIVSDRSTPSPSPSADAEVWIGDPALQHRQALQERGWVVWDLGKAWRDWAQLPFVFAFWALRRDVPASSIVRTLVQARDEGLKNLESICRKQSSFDFATAYRYLSQNVSYDFETEELKGLMKFQTLAARHDLIPGISEINLAE